MNLRQVRRMTYRAARVMGDVDAARHGPSAYGRRVVRRRVYRASGGATRELCRALGL